MAVLASACTALQEIEPEALPEPREQGGALGVPIEHWGMSVEIQAIEAFDQSVDSFPRLKVTVRSENLSDTTQRNPLVQLWCDESQFPGEWYEGSTWEASEFVKPGHVREGEAIVGFPAKEHAPRYAVARCSNARVKVTATRRVDNQASVAVYAVGPELIDAAIDAPRGRQLPLPLGSN